MDNSYLFVNGKEICKFKAGNGIDIFLHWFCLGYISEKMIKIDPKKYLLKEMCTIFQLIIMLLINLTY